VAQVKDLPVDAVGRDRRRIAGFAAAPADPARLAATQKRPPGRVPHGPQRLAQRAASAPSRLVAVTGDGRGGPPYATYAAVTPADVQSAAREFLTSSRRTVAVLRGTP
jgi:hypothetical protein